MEGLACKAVAAEVIKVLQIMLQMFLVAVENQGRLEKVEAMEQNLQQVKLMVSQILLRLFFHSSLNPQLLPIKEL